jgi:hypothetical protein
VPSPVFSSPPTDHLQRWRCELSIPISYHGSRFTKAILNSHIRLSLISYLPSNAAIFKDYLPLMRGLISLVVVLATTIPFPTLVGASPIHHSPRSPRGHGNVHGNARRGGGALLPRQSGGSCTDGDWNCDGMKLQSESARSPR